MGRLTMKTRHYNVKNKIRRLLTCVHTLRDILDLENRIFETGNVQEEVQVNLNYKL